MAVKDGPVKMPELNLIPESERGIELDSGMKKIMATLTAYWRERLIALRATPGGSLFVSSPQMADIVHVLATSSNFEYQGPDIQCSEVMVMGHPSNGNIIWTRPHKIATVDNAWPLLKYDVVSFTVTNLSMLHLFIPTDTERVIVAYTL